MRDELLKAEDANIFVVDWAGGSLPLYTQATANTRLVGLEVAYLINHLVVGRLHSIKVNNQSYINHIFFRKIIV